MAEVLSVLFIGLVVGSIYSLAAIGLVLTYRISGVFNFAQGAIGMLFAFLFFQLTQGGRMNLIFGVYDQGWKLPAPVALVLVVGVLAPGLGWALDAILFRKLRDAGTVVRIVATIGVLIALTGVAGVVWGTTARLTPKSVFPVGSFTIGGFTATYVNVINVLVTLGLAGALLAFLKFSPLGVRMRAVVDRPDVSELMGVNSARISGLAWGIGTGFAALAGILLAPFFGSLDPLQLTFLVIIATAAAVVGRLEHIPLTLVGGFAIGIAQQFIQRYASSDLAAKLYPSIPFIILFVAVFLPIRWPAAQERPPPPPKVLPKARSFEFRATSVGLIVAALIVPALFATFEWQNMMALVPPMAMIFLSLVLLSGYAGQVSLGQAAFAGFGAFTAVHLISDHGWPFLPAVVAAGLLTVPLGALLAFRATRLPPLFLGFATLAFAAVMDEVAFKSADFSGGLSGYVFQRPSFASSPLTFYLFGIGVFLLFALVVTNIRKGKIGLALTAMRDSPTAVASSGASVSQLKFIAFCVSAFIAGVGGAMLAAGSGFATPTSFVTLVSLLMLSLAVIGGINTWTGALVGAVLFLLFAPTLQLPLVQHSWIAKHVFHGLLGDANFMSILFGLGAVGLARNPGGVVEQIREGTAKFAERIAWLRSLGRKATAPETSQEPAEVEEAAPAAVPAGDGRAVSFPQASLYHRPDCVLTVGKEAEPVSGNGGRLRPCPICEPEAVRT